jgi:hypothetical protein
VLLLVERKRVQPLEYTSARNKKSHGFSKDIADESQEDHGDEDSLRFEHIDGCKYGSKARQSSPYQM